jgi:hypothetical protein
MRRRSIVMLLTSSALLVAAMISRPAPAPLPFLDAYGAAELYSRKVPLSAPRQVIVRAYTLPLDYETAVGLAAIHYEGRAGWRGRANSFPSTLFWRGGKDDFEMVRIYPAQLMRSPSKEYTAEPSDGRRWTMVVYSRSPNPVEATIGRLVAPILEGREKADKSSFTVLWESYGIGNGSSGGFGRQVLTYKDGVWVDERKRSRSKVQF